MSVNRKKKKMNTRTLHLEKGGHTYLMKYAPGLEDEVVEELMYLADDCESDFDWLDAAALSFQVTQFAAEDCLDPAEMD